MYTWPSSSSDLEQMDGQFDDSEADPAVVTATGASSPELGEEGEESGDDESWELEYGDWQTETGDFTKKLNAVRSGQAGTNAQQRKMGAGDVSHKAIQVIVLSTDPLGKAHSLSIF